MPLRKQACPEGGGLLVSSDAGDRDRRAKELAVSLAKDTARVPDLGEHLAWDVQDREQLLVPLLAMDVEEQRATGVRGVGRVHPPPGQPPEQEGIDGPGENLASRRAASQSAVPVEQVLELGAGKIRIEHQTGLASERPLETVCLQSIADRRRDPTLPDDGIGDRVPGRLLPDDDRLSLVGDADRRHVARRRARRAERCTGRGQLRRPDGLRVVLHVARRGKDLRKLALRRRRRATRATKHDRAARGGALIQGQNDLRHATSYQPSAWNAKAPSTPPASGPATGTQP